MKKETQDIAINTSSGAEKVEKIEQEKRKTSEKTPVKKVQKQVTVQKKTQSAKGDAALGDSKPLPKRVNAKTANTRSTDGKAEAESAAAKARVEAAIRKKAEKEKRKEARAKRLAAKRAAREKLVAERKAKIAKQNAEWQALIEKRAAERKEKAAKRAAERKALAEKRAAQKKTKRQKPQKRQAERKNHGERRERREKGYGGWIAAVVTLGVTTLALATTATVGSIEMSRANQAMTEGYRSTMYELTGVLENVENDLDRVRISASTSQQSRLLTDLLVQARLAEMDIERLPICAEADRNMTSFVNRTAAVCEGMLAKLRGGEQLNAQDREILESLYQTNRAVRETLNRCVGEMKNEDLMDFFKKGKGAIADSMTEIEQMTLEENRLSVGKMEQLREGKTELSTKGKEMPERMESARAEELCAQYFKGYKVQEFQCVGETVARGYAAYNIQGYDDKGSLLFAEIDQISGKLIRFDYYEECAGDTFDLPNAERIAGEFLDGLGYENLEVVRARQNGSTVDFTFVYESDGVVYYPDEIRVKVCRTRGVVSGMDASKYLKHHRERGDLEVEFTLAQAYDKLYKDLNVESARLTVVKTMRGEKTAYELLCSYGEDQYLIYLDAVSGEEISILNVNTIR